MLNTALLSGHAPLGIALSGGGDSTALLILLHDALGPQNLRAITIDHGLRGAAKEEAALAANLCASHGIKHATVVLDLKDGPDLQARARDARYDALGSWAAQNQISAIALGHTMDDVAETFLMRLARGSGVDGLAAMPERFTRAGTTFLRPLLQASRANLQALLVSRSIGWSEDPSNTDPRFTRVQMRQARPALDDLGLSTDRLAQTADWMRAASEVLENAADAWIAEHAFCDHGDAVFDTRALKQAPKETACRVLSRVLCNISGNMYRPRFSALNDLLCSERAQTLHGCLAYPHKNHLRVTREFNAIKAIDQRWTLTGPLEPDHTIAPLGETGLKHCENWRDTALLPRRSLLASPAVWSGQTLVAAPLAKPDQRWRVKTTNPLHLAK